MWRYAKLIKVISHRPGVVEEQRPNGDAFLMGGRVRTDENGFACPSRRRRMPARPAIVWSSRSVTRSPSAGACPKA
jgi:hypothetical protein